MSVALGPTTILIGIAITAAGKDVAAFDAVTHGSATFTFDETSVPASIKSLLADGRSILTDTQDALGAAAKTGPVATYLAALGTIVSLFEATAGVAGATPGARPTMTEGAALAALKVRQ